MLEISANSLTGTIPAGWLPDSLSSLNLTGNQLTARDGLPPLPSHLSDLSLAGNPLGARLPALLAALPRRLVQLDLTNASLAGTLPAAAQPLLPPGLVLLGLGSNRLRGPIPASFLETLQPGLGQVCLDSNVLTGPLPASRPDQWVRTALRLQGNRLGGTLPARSGLLQSFQWVGLFDNRLTGDSPAARPTRAVSTVACQAGDRHLPTHQPTHPPPCRAVSRHAASRGRRQQGRRAAAAGRVRLLRQGAAGWAGGARVTQNRSAAVDVALGLKVRACGHPPDLPPSCLAGYHQVPSMPIYSRVGASGPPQYAFPPLKDEDLPSCGGAPAATSRP